jgi:hypothetical protein
MSCGGFRRPSDPRVPSIESRCVTDKAAVLRCVLRRYPSAAAGKSCFLRIRTLLNIHSAVRFRCTRGHRQLASATPAWTLFVACTESYPHNPQVIHRGHQHGWIRGSAALAQRTGDSVSAPPKQVSRYASPLGPSRKAHHCPALWITCAVSGIACAQPVGDPVETKKL